MATEEQPVTASAYMTMFINTVAGELSDKLDFRDPTDWKQWISRRERYRVVFRFHLPDDTHMNTLLYSMGMEAEDILFLLRLFATDFRE